jgi:hypothetical protein
MLQCSLFKIAANSCIQLDANENKVNETKVQL